MAYTMNDLEGIVRWGSLIDITNAKRQPSDPFQFYFNASIYKLKCMECGKFDNCGKLQADKNLGSTSDAPSSSIKQGNNLNGNQEPMASIIKRPEIFKSEPPQKNAKIIKKSNENLLKKTTKNNTPLTENGGMLKNIRNSTLFNKAAVEEKFQFGNSLIKHSKSKDGHSIRNKRKELKIANTATTSSLEDLTRNVSLEKTNNICHLKPEASRRCSMRLQYNGTNEKTSTQIQLPAEFKYLFKSKKSKLGRNKKKPLDISESTITSVVEAVSNVPLQTTSNNPLDWQNKCIQEAQTTNPPEVNISKRNVSSSMTEVEPSTIVSLETTMIEHIKPEQKRKCLARVAKSKTPLKIAHNMEMIGLFKSKEEKVKCRNKQKEADKSKNASTNKAVSNVTLQTTNNKPLHWEKTDIQEAQTTIPPKVNISERNVSSSMTQVDPSAIVSSKTAMSEHIKPEQKRKSLVRVAKSQRHLNIAHIIDHSLPPEIKSLFKSKEKKVKCQNKQKKVDKSKNTSNSKETTEETSLYVKNMRKKDSQEELNWKSKFNSTRINKSSTKVNIPEIDISAISKTHNEDVNPKAYEENASSEPVKCSVSTKPKSKIPLFIQRYFPPNKDKREININKISNLNVTNSKGSITDVPLNSTKRKINSNLTSRKNVKPGFQPWRPSFINNRKISDSTQITGLHELEEAEFYASVNNLMDNDSFFREDTKNYTQQKRLKSNETKFSGTSVVNYKNKENDSQHSSMNRTNTRKSLKRKLHSQSFRDSHAFMFDI